MYLPVAIDLQLLLEAFAAELSGALVLLGGCSVILAN